jgi:hypothetical protein
MLGWLWTMTVSSARHDALTRDVTRVSAPTGFLAHTGLTLDSI